MRLIPLLVAVVLSVPLAVSAEPIPITGVITLSARQAGSINVAGDGFGIQGVVAPGVAPLGCCLLPGSEYAVNLNLSSGHFLSTEVTLGGETFPLGPSAIQNAAISLQVRGLSALPIPDLTQGMASVSAPFTLTGTVRHTPFGTLPTLPTAEVFGTGTAMLSLFSSGPAWDARTLQLTLDPEPVPEPATLLLVGTGLFAAYRSRRRKVA